MIPLVRNRKRTSTEAGLLEVSIGFALYAPTNEKRHAELRRLKVWGGRGFAVSRKRESYGKNLLKQIDDRRHFKLWKNNKVTFMPR